MGFFDAFQQMGAANIQGQQILANLDESKAEAQLKQQQIIGAQAANAANAKAAANSAALADWMSSNSAVKDGSAATAADTATQFASASKFAAQRGDFDGAQAMAKLASGQLETASKEQLLNEKSKADATDALSTVAQDTQASPTPENHAKLFKTAIAAGVSPADIPMPGTPEYGTFLNQSTLASMKGAARLEYLESIRKTQQQEKDRAAADDQRHEDAESARKDRAVAREQTFALQKQGLDIRRQLADSTIAAANAKAAAADAGGAIGHRQTVAAVNYTNEVARGLNLVAEMSKGDTNGTFAHMENPTTILKSLESYGTNTLTPARVQMLQTATKGLGLELAQTATAGSGRGPNQSVINEMAEMVAPKKGDNEYEALFKLSNAADFARTRAEAIPDSKDPKIQAVKVAAMDQLARFPHPLDIVQQARAHGYNMDSTLKTTKTMRQNLDSMITKHNNAAPPPEVQSILDQYPASKP